MKRIIPILLVLLPIGVLAQSSLPVECGYEGIYVLTATADDGFHFVKWLDDVNAPNPREVQVTDNIIYTAVFALNGTPDTIVNGQKENVSELYSNAAGTIDTIVIQPGGELTIDVDKTISTLIIESDGTQSGQVHSTSNLNASEMYLDYRLNPVGDEASPDQWYAVAVPFTVNIQDGVTRKEGSSSHIYGSDFLFLTYDSEMRAQTGKGWKQMTGTEDLEAGKFYLMGIEGTCNHWLFKKKGGTDLPASTVNVTYFPSGNSNNAGIIGIANPTLEYLQTNLDPEVYICFYDNEHGVFEDPIKLNELTEATFAVGKPFFIQVEADIDINFGNNSSAAPRRASMSVNPLMRMLLTNTQNEEFGRMYISLHNDNQTGHYVIGRDFARMDNKNTRPHLWYEAFGLQLAAHGIQAPSTTTEVPFVMSTPVAGHFRLTMSTRAMDDYMVELLYNGEYVANLSDDEPPYAFELNKGVTNGYSIRLRAKSPTDIKPVQGEEATSAKILLNNQLYIRHGEHVYDAQGRKIK